VFDALGSSTGIGADQTTGRAPRIHDLRHTFAVTALLGWYREGQDVAGLIPGLSTYLGHRDPRNTYWYLSAVPELLAATADRLGPIIGAGVSR
jgi:integrase